MFIMNNEQVPFRKRTHFHGNIIIYILLVSSQWNHVIAKKTQSHSNGHVNVHSNITIQKKMHTFTVMLL